MILSDRSIREAVEGGRLVIDPYDPECVQPSSYDIRVGDSFRVFHNARHPYIDVRQPQEDLTELIAVPEGEAFILHPGEFVLGTSLERVKLPDDLVARLEGKALALSTPVPTPDGWKTMGDLRTGDKVFDEGGATCPVIAATDVLEGRRCFEVVFSDGTSVVADAAHQWVTVDKNGRRYGRMRFRIVTTLQVAQTLTVRGEVNHHVPLAGPVHYPSKTLAVDPYVLGIWLGDGTSTKAEITCADQWILDEIRRRGYAVAKTACGPYRHGVGGTGRTRDLPSGRYASNGSLSSALRRLGLLGRKAVPRAYLEAGVGQRLELLQGLMDSDGYVDTYGRCEYSSTNERLADAVVELGSSLGFRPVKSKKTARLDGIDCGPAYLVKFSPHESVFRLPRKRARLDGATRRWKHLFRGIVDVREVDSVPVRCIQVGSPSGMFLVTRGFIPTHNSSLGRLGLLIHSTAGFIDCGFAGRVTLELSNVANLPIAIYPGMKIGQISFYTMTTAADRPYGSKEVGSKYQGQEGPTPSRYFEEFKPGD